MSFYCIVIDLDSIQIPKERLGGPEGKRREQVGCRMSRQQKFVNNKTGWVEVIFFSELLHKILLTFFPELKF